MNKRSNYKKMLIAVDGPAASGKGTLAKRLARHFNLAHLDTGLLYRATGYGAITRGDVNNSDFHLAAARALTAEDLHNPALRLDEAGRAASIAGSIPEVRQALLQFQRDFAENPPADKNGAILDGRDIGTVICPDADVKLFVTAAVEIRARRRYKELIQRGEEVIYARILADLRERDARDSQRAVAPLKAAEDAIILDTTGLEPEDVFAIAILYIGKKGKPQPR